MKIKFYLVIFFIVSTSLTAQVTLDFSGYLYDVPTFYFKPASADFFGLEDNENIYPMNLTRLRLRPTLNFSENSRITMQYEANLLFSKMPIPLVEGTGMTNRQALDLHWRFYNKNNFTAQHFIDILYYKHIFDFAEVVFGRQVISWGVGRIWQPTDLFNPINPANFSKLEKDGADAFSAKFFISDFTDFELVCNFRENQKDYNYGARFRTNFSEYDVSAMAGYFDRKVIVGGDFTGNFFNAGLRGEGIFSYDPDSPDSNYVRAILGLDYQFTSELYGLIEYQFNGRGTACKDCYDFDRLKRGEIQNVGLNYVTVQSNYQIHPLVTINAGAMLNINDLSGYFNAGVTYSIFESLNLSLGGMYFIGSEKDEFWYYPSAVYLSGQWFY
ncbi:MAG: hypothetical protein A2X61_02620 [Ignavibacteria bacterium GWB2_35_12]|nr:MAG: hypothetical protein A2X63_11330 [Ignavibacteria bacterium GWA2_35_8]OGU42471.1 MAG: hypothetical protein A2X61_02620 [Ignavibacteria bacterium GWB2_35_12]OGV24251.1 MAG: hypothetical protein A2475_08545 [Ignavibacteria bacterium RIFOXYC2_FULL_35_21]